MKKLTLILGMIACILCLSACGSQTETANSSEQKLTQEEALAYGDQLVEDINAIVQGNMEAQFAQELESRTGRYGQLSEYHQP